MGERNVVRSDFSRLFLLEGGPRPDAVPIYEGLWKAGQAKWPQGDAKKVASPDSMRYGKFIKIDTIPGDPGNPELPVTARYTMDKSDLLRLVRGGCNHGLQVHFGKCQDPRDFNNGWDKILVLEAARLTDYSTSELGAMEEGERAVVTEEVPFTGEDLYEIGKLRFAELAKAQAVREIADIMVVSDESCGGDCGAASDGLQIVLAVATVITGSPGYAPEVIWSKDGGSNWEDTNIVGLAANQGANAIAVAGTYVVVISKEAAALCYCRLSELLSISETWTKVTTGFVAGKGPLGMHSLGPSTTWIVGQGGYIYFSTDPTGGVVVKNAGSATTQDLIDVHAYDLDNIIAGGGGNTFVYSTDGGVSWASVVGPLGGSAINCVFMRTRTEWWVGTNLGRTFYTRDGGTTWIEKGFPGSGSGTVTDIRFVTQSVGYMAHATATPVGRILRTLDGGNSWYVLPEGAYAMPAADRFNKIAHGSNANVLFAGGLADDASDGIIVKGS